MGTELEDSNRDNGILIGMLTVKDGTTDLTNTNDAIFHIVSKFGENTSTSSPGKNLLRCSTKASNVSSL